MSQTVSHFGTKKIVEQLLDQGGISLGESIHVAILFCLICRAAQRYCRSSDIYGSGPLRLLSDIWYGALLCSYARPGEDSEITCGGSAEAKAEGG